MKTNFTQLYLHCVWATWDRLPLITPEIQPILYADIVRQCEKLKSTVIAVGGIEDHVHLLVRFSPTLCLSDLMKAVKGSSSHLITHVVNPNEFFKWQGSYGAFSINHSDIDQVAQYIRTQADHHHRKSTILTWETTAAEIP
jgi:putative transposase